MNRARSLLSLYTLYSVLAGLFPLWSCGDTGIFTTVTEYKRNRAPVIRELQIVDTNRNPVETGETNTILVDSIFFIELDIFEAENDGIERIDYDFTIGSLSGEELPSVNNNLPPDVINKKATASATFVIPASLPPSEEVHLAISITDARGARRTESILFGVVKSPIELVGATVLAAGPPLELQWSADSDGFFQVFPKDEEDACEPNDTNLIFPYSFGDTEVSTVPYIAGQNICFVLFDFFGFARHTRIPRFITASKRPLDLASR